MTTQEKATPKSDMQRLEDGLALVEEKGMDLPGDTAFSMGVGVMETMGVSNVPFAPGRKVGAYGVVTRKLSQVSGPRSEDSVEEVKRAFRTAIRQIKNSTGKPAAPAAGRRGFTEKVFLEEFNALIAQNNAEKALDLLIDVLPNIQESRMNRKEKLKHLTFAGRRLQHAGLGKYGIQKLASKAKVALDVAKQHGLSGRDTFVDFGCGAHEPLGLATFFYANGFKRAFGNDFLPLRSPEYAALSMYDILSYMRNFPEEFLAFDQTETAYSKRLAEFDLKRLMKGDFEGGVSGAGDAVKFLSCDIRDSGLDPESVSYLVSFAVFEHVLEIDSVCAYLFERSEPGGLQHHFIDLADHRAYRHDGVFNKFSFLTEDEAAPNLNRLRASEHIAAFEAAGFEILHSERQFEEIPPDTFERFLPKWRDMPLEDQQAITLTVTLRKP